MKKALLLLIFTTLVIGLVADNLTIQPTDDMYTDTDHPGAAPVTTQLWTANFSPSGHFERIMMKFDIDAILGHELDSAILHLTRLYSCPSGGTTAVTFYLITEEWDENTWNHTQHISYSEEHSMPYVFSGNGGNTIVEFDVDISSLIQPIVDGTIANNGFVIMANSNNKFSKFYSKEDATRVPSLALEYTVVANDIDPINSVSLSQNYPNPFYRNNSRSAGTTIKFNLNENQNVDLSIYNILGQKINTIVNKNYGEGEHFVVWNGKDTSNKEVAEGVYFYKLKTRNNTLVKKLIVIN